MKPPAIASPGSSAGRSVIYAALLLVVVVWGGSFVAARTVLDPASGGGRVLSPTLLATTRFMLASLVFVPVLWRERRRSAIVRAGDLPRLFLVGQLGFSIYFWLQYTGVRLTNAGVAAVLVVGIIPLATMATSTLFLHERMRGPQLMGLGLGSLGVLVVASQGSLVIATNIGFLLGSLCLVANAFCFALYTTAVRGLRDRYSSPTITATTMLAGAAGLALVALATEDWCALLYLSNLQWGAIAYLALVCSVVAYFLYHYVLARLEAGRAASWLYLEPLMAVGLAFLLLGEVVAVQTLAGGLLIVIGLYLAHRR